MLYSKLIMDLLELVLVHHAHLVGLSLKVILPLEQLEHLGLPLADVVFLLFQCCPNPPPKGACPNSLKGLQCLWTNPLLNPNLRHTIDRALTGPKLLP